MHTSRHNDCIVVKLCEGTVKTGTSLLNAHIGPYPDALVLNVTAVTADINGKTSTISSVGCMINDGVFPELELSITVDPHRQHVSLIFRTMAANEGSLKGYQFVAESVITLGVEITEGTYTYTDNKCMHPPNTHKDATLESPLCRLLRNGELYIRESKLLGTTTLLPGSLFDWSDPPHVSGYISVVLIAPADQQLYDIIKQNAQHAPDISMLTKDNELILAETCKADARYAQLWRAGQHLRYPRQ